MKSKYVAISGWHPMDLLMEYERNGARGQERIIQPGGINEGM